MKIKPEEFKGQSFYVTYLILLLMVDKGLGWGGKIHGNRFE